MAIFRPVLILVALLAITACTPRLANHNRPVVTITQIAVGDMLEVSLRVANRHREHLPVERVTAGWTLQGRSMPSLSTNMALEVPPFASEVFVVRIPATATMASLATADELSYTIEPVLNDTMALRLGAGTLSAVPGVGGLFR